jgi:hypothetical protein
VETVFDTLDGEITNATGSGRVGGELSARVDLIVEPEYLVRFCV